ncbi:hypothetical protein FXO38_09937 [Capsicum annuum]|nr:hypothetical protein FXO38_09937 [Capsicum annuum]KAF3664991.1 hypothetical protein FXO37_11234 [Capsicum annuum]
MNKERLTAPVTMTMICLPVVLMRVRGLAQTGLFSPKREWLVAVLAQEGTFTVAIVKEVSRGSTVFVATSPYVSLAQFRPVQDYHGIYYRSCKTEAQHSCPWSVVADFVSLVMSPLGSNLQGVCVRSPYHYFGCEIERLAGIVRVCSPYHYFGCEIERLAEDPSARRSDRFRTQQVVSEPTVQRCYESDDPMVDEVEDRGFRTPILAGSASDQVRTGQNRMAFWSFFFGLLFLFVIITTTTATTITTTNVRVGVIKKPAFLHVPVFREAPAFRNGMDCRSLERIHVAMTLDANYLRGTVEMYDHLV